MGGGGGGPPRIELSLLPRAKLPLLVVEYDDGGEPLAGRRASFPYGEAPFDMDCCCWLFMVGGGGGGPPRMVLSLLPRGA